MENPKVQRRFVHKEILNEEDFFLLSTVEFRWCARVSVTQQNLGSERTEEDFSVGLAFLFGFLLLAQRSLIILACRSSSIPWRATVLTRETVVFRKEQYLSSRSSNRIGTGASWGESKDKDLNLSVSAGVRSSAQRSKVRSAMSCLTKCELK